MGGAVHGVFAGEFFGQGEGDGEEAEKMEGAGLSDGVVGEPDRVCFAVGGEFLKGDEQDPFGAH